MADTSPITLGGADRLERRAQIAALEQHMLAMDASEQLSIPDMTQHFFAGGVYARQMSIPAGAVVVGKIHKSEHLSILLAGRVRITTDTGTIEMEAPQVMVSPPGTKRIAHALTDTIWLAVHAVGEERDLDAIEERFIAPSFEDYERLASGAVHPQLEEAA